MRIPDALRSIADFIESHKDALNDAISLLRRIRTGEYAPEEIDTFLKAHAVVVEPEQKPEVVETPRQLVSRPTVGRAKMP